MDSSPPAADLFDENVVTNYYIRGEGMANLVIGFVRGGGGENFVWRINKKTTFDDGEFESAKKRVRYIREILLPLFRQEDGMSNFISPPSLVEIPAKIAREIMITRHFSGDNKKQQQSSLAELLAEKLGGRKNDDDDRNIYALEMLDFTLLPPRPLPKLAKNFVSSPNHYPIICVEIKPKQGYIPDDFRRVSKDLLFRRRPESEEEEEEEISYCLNCAIQYGKSKSSIDRSIVDRSSTMMYDYCPMDLFSGDDRRMRGSIQNLLLSPGKRHIKIFRDGRPIIEDEIALLELEKIGGIFFDDDDDQTAAMQQLDLADILVRVLKYTPSFVEDDDDQKSSPKQQQEDDGSAGSLPKGCVLDCILKGQQMDELGPINAASLITTGELLAKNQFLADPQQEKGYSLFFPPPPAADSEIMIDQQQQQVLDQLRAAIVCATLRDCSIMITMRLTEGNNDDLSSPSIPVVVSADHRSDRFAIDFRINVIDLDIKSPAKLVSFSKRCRESLKLLLDDYAANTYRRTPCDKRE